MVANNITVLDAADSQQILQTVCVANVHTPVHLAELFVANNYATNANPIPVTLASTSTTETVVPFFTVAANSFGRPNNATAYASGQLIANSTTNTSVVAMAFSVARISGQPCRIARASLQKSSNTTGGASFRLHLYANSSIVPTNGDGGTWLTNASNTYVGWLDCTIDKAFSDGAVGPFIATGGTSLPTNTAVDLFFLPAGATTSIYGLLEARGAYTPANSEVFVVKLFVTNY